MARLETRWSQCQACGTAPKLLISFPQHSFPQHSHLEMQASGVPISRVAEGQYGVMCTY